MIYVMQLVVYLNKLLLWSKIYKACTPVWILKTNITKYRFTYTELWAFDHVGRKCIKKKVLFFVSKKRGKSNCKVKILTKKVQNLIILL